ncbi:MMPL family transporter [Corynebacterium kroppenstedtii]|uniref:MMPL family transporter n=1 Tax=Corynebacterium sp. PCR 32 TaxID=3351342 RepID=UPI0030B1DBF1
MARFLYRVGSSAYRHKWRFIAVWLLILIGMGAAATSLSESTSSTFSIPGIESEKAQNLMKERFPGVGNQASTPTGTVVFRADNGKTLTDPDMQQKINSTLIALKDAGILKNTDALVDPATAAAGVSQKIAAAGQQQQLPEPQIAKNIQSASPLSHDQKTGTVGITFDAKTVSSVPASSIDKFEDIISHSRSSDLTIEYEGQAFTMQPPSSSVSELIGIAVGFLVLIITFGSLIAAGMPIITALVGVAIGNLGVVALTGLVDSVNNSTPMLASMLGLAVGIDYALFITSRYKNELTQTNNRIHAAGRAVGTAGSSVVFAGLTVIVALCALTVVNIPFLSTMALTAAATVAIAVLVALTLLPAVLGLFGTAFFKGNVPFIEAPDPERDKPTMGLRWVRLVRKQPWAFVGVGVVALVLIAIPMTRLDLALPTDATSDPAKSPRHAYELVDDAFGPGRNAPLLAVVDAKDVPQDQRPLVFAKAAQEFTTVDGVKNAMVGQLNKAGDTAQILIEPTTGSVDEKTKETLQAIRNKETSFTNETKATYGVTGITAIQTDISDRLDNVLIPYIAIVLVLAFFILMVVFRSIPVPLVAALGFGLTVCATFGLTVGVFQEGWLGIISDPQPITSFLPIILIGIVFGLAMDYEVFLVSRMREMWHHGEAAGNAAVNGFKHGARVVTAAALIMISVFAAFVLQDLQVIKTMGFALAVAVFIDAFIVRMTLIPATMFILDEKAWWIPKWLDRITPRVDVEGEGITDISNDEHSSGSTKVDAD